MSDEFVLITKKELWDVYQSNPDSRLVIMADGDVYITPNLSDPGGPTYMRLDVDHENFANNVAVKVQLNNMELPDPMDHIADVLDHWYDDYIPDDDFDPCEA